MEGRTQFTFYRSFWEAVCALPKKDQLPVLTAVIEYALDGKEPQGLSMNQSAFFLLCRPNLDASRRKAENGKQGGSRTKANGKQTASKKEKEKENENEIARENDKKQALSDESFLYFWNNYPETGKGDLGNAAAAWQKLTEPERDKVGRQLDAWKLSQRWTSDGGAFIPLAENFLDPGRGYLTAVPSAGAAKGVPYGCTGIGEADREIIKKMLMEE